MNALGVNIFRLVLMSLVLTMVSGGCASSKGSRWAEGTLFQEVPGAKQLKLQKQSVTSDVPKTGDLPPVTKREYENQGDVSFGRGDLGTAFLQYQKALRLEPGDLTIMYKSGLLFLIAGVNSEAVKIFQEIIEEQPKHALSHEGLGMAYFQMKDYKTAGPLFKRALELDPDLWKSHNFLGVIQDYADNHEAAVKRYEAAIALKEDEAVLYHNLGTSYLMAGEEEKAVEALRMALDHEGDFEQTYNNLGLALCHLGRYEEAINIFTLAKDEAQAHNNVGCALLARGEYEAAVKHFEKAIELRSTYYTIANKNLKKGVSNQSALLVP